MDAEPDMTTGKLPVIKTADGIMYTVKNGGPHLRVWMTREHKCVSVQPRSVHGVGGAWPKKLTS